MQRTVLNLKERVSNPPQEQDGEYASPWQWYEEFDGGEPVILAGEVVALDERDGKYGRYFVLTVEQEDGEQLAFHAVSRGPKERIEELDPHPGDVIAIAYHGKKKTQKGRDFHVFAIELERED